MSLEIKISKRLIPYKYAFKALQKRAFDLEKGKKNELLWILEHPLTFTAGIKSNKNEVLDKKVNLIKTNRGGKITLHSPGQKIIYFVLNLNKRKKDIRNLVNVIENCITDFLKIYEINSAADRKNIGIWVKNKKIAAIGIKVSKWIAYHGCSINISNNLDYYKRIIPCGLNNTKVTSIKSETKKKILNVNDNLKKIFTNKLKNI
jgi:lipoyl(octanoyl) transferase